MVTRRLEDSQQVIVGNGTFFSHHEEFARPSVECQEDATVETNYGIKYLHSFKTSTLNGLRKAIEYQDSITTNDDIINALISSYSDHRLKVDMVIVEKWSKLNIIKNNNTDISAKINDRLKTISQKDVIYSHLLVFQNQYKLVMMIKMIKMVKT